MDQDQQRQGRGRMRRAQHPGTHFRAVLGVDPQLVESSEIELPVLLVVEMGEAGELLRLRAQEVDFGWMRDARVDHHRGPVGREVEVAAGGYVGELLVLSVE